MVVFCTSHYQLLLIEFTQQHPTPPWEVVTNPVITSLFYLPKALPSFHRNLALILRQAPAELLFSLRA